jgi:hypothetical protein
MLAGFYHRSVLRCGCLAERKSGVGVILTAERARENICILDCRELDTPGSLDA